MIRALKPRPPSMKQIAGRIDAHLRRIEADPKLNKRLWPGKDFRLLFMSGCCAGGSRISVCYVSYQGRSSLTRDEATRYLAWLDAGNVGRHQEALQ